MRRSSFWLLWTIHTTNLFQQLLPKGEDLPFWERIHFLVLEESFSALSEYTKLGLLLCMLLVFRTLRNVSFSNNNHILKFSTEGFENLPTSFFFLIPKICYQVLSSAHGCFYTSHSGSFIQKFTTRWQIIMILLLFHMKHILIKDHFCWTDIFIRWFEDYQLPATVDSTWIKFIFLFPFNYHCHF